MMRSMRNRNRNSVVAECSLVMDFFQHRYYKITKILMSMVGLWPYQPARVSWGCHAFVMFVAISHMIPQIIAIIEYHDDRETLLESCISFMFLAAMFAKFYSSKWNAQTMLQLLYRIRMDWKVWARDPEVNILHEYAEQGRKMTFVYAVIIYSTGILFSLQPIGPKIIDVLMGNGSKPGEFTSPVDYYYFDQQKYYFYVSIHTTVAVAVGFLVAIANDTMFIVYVQHSCGIFSALGHKLKQLGIKESVAETTEIGDEFDEIDTDFEQLTWCIKRHNEAIEYADLIESTYSWCFFLIVGCNMLIISITGLQIVNSTTDSQETTKFIACNMAAMVHLYIESYMSQILIDHSVSIRYYIYSGKWYGLSVKAQKAIYLMIVRCNVSCKLTAGKIAVMSVENFAVILKTSLSCLTILRST